jgi:ubiquinone/menaquinone biosynthesis C-methylase UbiE
MPISVRAVSKELFSAGPRIQTMGFHTFDAGRAEKLERARRYRFLSSEELLWALSLEAGDTVADLGSGTGFYTDEVAPHAGRVVGVDVQAAMHDYYREKGVPANVELVTSGVSDLPLPDGSLEAAFATMTYHEFASSEAHAELARVLTAGGRLVLGDWAATGNGDEGAPLDERFSATEATQALRAHGFQVTHSAVRPETFLLVASR